MVDAHISLNLHRLAGGPHLDSEMWDVVEEGWAACWYPIKPILMGTFYNPMSQRRDMGHPNFFLDINRGRLLN